MIRLFVFLHLLRELEGYAISFFMFFLSKELIKRVSSCLVFFLWQGSSIGIYFINRPEWLIVEHACSAYSFVSVPLYDTLGRSFSNTEDFIYGNNFLKLLLNIYLAGPEAAKYITNHAALKAIFCMPQTLYNVRFLA